MLVSQCGGGSGGGDGDGGGERWPTETVSPTSNIDQPNIVGLGQGNLKKILKYAARTQMHHVHSGHRAMPDHSFVGADRGGLFPRLALSECSPGKLPRGCWLVRACPAA